MASPSRPLRNSTRPEDRQDGGDKGVRKGQDNEDPKSLSTKMKDLKISGERGPGMATTLRAEEDLHQTKEEIELELEKLFFAGMAKCINGHIYKRICMMGPCPICNGLQYQFSPDEPLFDYDYEPEAPNDDADHEEKIDHEPRPSTSRGGMDGQIHDAIFDQIERDRLYALELQAEENEELQDLPNYAPIVPGPPWLRDRKEAEYAPPAPPEKILQFYIEFEKVFALDVELDPRECLEQRLHKGYILPPFPSLTMDEKWAVLDARTAKQQGRKYLHELERDKEFRVIMEASRRYHTLNPVPVTLATKIRCQEFRWPRDQMWRKIKAEVEEENNAKEQQEANGTSAKNMNGNVDEDKNRDKQESEPENKHLG